jgi:hypothetical protein
MGGWWLVAAALAAPVSVEASRDVAATPEAVRAALADAEVALGRNPDVRAVTVAPGDGDCASVVVTTRGMAAPFTYRALRCPTADGFREVLVASDHFAVNETIWSVTAMPGGARVTLRVTTEPRLTVPEWVLRRAVAASAEATVEAVARGVAPAPPPTGDVGSGDGARQPGSGG